MFWYPFTRRRWEKLEGPWPQKLLQAAFDWYQMRLNFLWGYFDAPTGEEFELRMQREADLRDVPISKIYTDYVSQIEVKAASLLQHISVMLALTSIYFATADAGLALRVFLTFEILAYLWAALACLRCLLQISTVQWMRGEEITIQEFDQAYSLEGLKREVIYRHAMQLLVVLTIMLAVAIVVHTIGVALQ